jgi:hypothetical protein
VKGKYRPKLQEDFNRYAKQIGILPGEMPQLITDKRQIQELNRERRQKDQWVGSASNYGACYTEQRIIYVNVNSRIREDKVYAHVKYTRRQLSRHKSTYRDYLDTLVHELVHYRFGYLKHGAKFEKRQREILRGKVFPQKTLFNDDSNSDSTKKNIAIEDNNNIANPLLPPPTLAPAPVQQPTQERQALICNYF